MANNSDSAVVALTILGSHALQTGKKVNAREENEQIKEIYAIYVSVERGSRNYLFQFFQLFNRVEIIDNVWETVSGIFLRADLSVKHSKLTIAGKVSDKINQK